MKNQPSVLSARSDTCFVLTIDRAQRRAELRLLCPRRQLRRRVLDDSGLRWTGFSHTLGLSSAVYLLILPDDRGRFEHGVRSARFASAAMQLELTRRRGVLGTNRYRSSPPSTGKTTVSASGRGIERVSTRSNVFALISRRDRGE